VVFQDNIRVVATDFEIGDYGTIYFGCFFPGPGQIKIGHNFWAGNDCIIDSQGGTTIGNNVGIGAHSQLWTHMKFGDVVAGCRFDSVAQLSVGHDVWLVGHNLVSPVKIGDRSVAMLGSLVTKDIPPDKTYAGSPATDQTNKFGPQFAETSTEYRIDRLTRMVNQFAQDFEVDNISKYVDVCSLLPQHWSGKKTVIAVTSRDYYKTGSPIEILLMRYLLPGAKYVPVYDSPSQRSAVSSSDSHNEFNKK
jgi:acetyltransferase-like isoleucine patch superfamily enzyme